MKNVWSKQPEFKRSNGFHNWYQSLVALDLGSTRKVLDGSFVIRDDDAYGSPLATDQRYKSTSDVKHIGACDEVSLNNVVAACSNSYKLIFLTSSCDCLLAAKMIRYAATGRLYAAKCCSNTSVINTAIDNTTAGHR
ncbi:hypothetical protein Tco_1056769 [Tanacetum coccineum]|uniref:Uncharacterized protein n=1 Tax=Tanacetum coccineum TaxID=301880 RepID=A0ABQ5H3H5_9ASTR